MQLNARNEQCAKEKNNADADNQADEFFIDEAKRDAEPALDGISCERLVSIAVYAFNFISCGPTVRDLSITTTLANPSLKKGLKCSFTPVNSAFAPFFASTWLHSLRYAEVSVTLSGWILILLILPVMAGADVSPQNRQLYAQAKQALDRNRLQDVEQLRNQLDGYPLDIYLDYYLLESRLRQVDGDEALRFMAESKHTPLRLRFKDKYLRRAGRDRRWSDFLAVAASLPRAVELQCYYHRAQYGKGNKDAAWAGARHLWNHGESRPKACDPLFKAWIADGQLDDELIWSRMMKSVDQRQGGLAQYVGRLGSGALQPWVETMMVMYRYPARLSQSKRLPVGERHALDIVSHSFPRLSRVDIDYAMRLWKSYQTRYSFNAEQLLQIQDALAYYILLRKKNAHKQWLDNYLVTRSDDKLLERRLRWAVADGDWADYLYLQPGLSVQRQQSAAWRYWKAFALQEMGKTNEAVRLWQALASERDYYGFISAERVGQAYALNHRPLQTSANTELLGHGGVLRTTELIHHKQLHLAQSEWSYMLSQLDITRKEHLARHAIASGWYRLGIDAANHAEAWDRLELRFPRPYQNVFSHYASQRGVADTELMAISRRESAFFPAARSPVGAKGLMQLMPYTAKAVARRLGQPQLTRNLYDVASNVSLGSAYYRQLLDQYQGNRVLTLAAYNAGPQRVKSWRSKERSMDVYRWVASIPFRETREYVQAVLAYNVLYNAFSNRQARLLNDVERIPFY